MRITFVFLLLAACSAPGGPDQVTDDWHVDAGGPPGEARCDPAVTSEPLPQRTNLFAGSSGGGPATMFTRDLYGLFRSHCGACHVEAGLGGFRVTSQTFPTVVGQNVLDRVKSDQAGFFMPPEAAGGKPYSSREPGDPVVQLVELIEKWIAQGRPDDQFVTGDGTGGGSSAYVLDDWLIDRMTNLGDCVPTPGLVGVRQSAMQELDDFFASTATLPESLADTDLSSLDGATLAQSGVIAYAPTYPLWTDDAGKLRHVRVPLGESIAFDAATQTFQIPAHTRFYKTFLREVIDANGFPSWRKIETRVIVSRPDTEGGGTTALYGTYVWNEDESEALLLQDPLRDGTPFRDRLISVIVDEPRAQEIIASEPDDLVYALEEENHGVVRHYAIPGSARCVQCHMGSPAASFILGFTPLQIVRREGEEGGVYEPGKGSELDQLERLIAYGVISGMTSPAEILPLETSQGARQPRNDAELRAQAYLLGNCAHCHNPRGFPSVSNPLLVEALDFLPSDKGGVFQFPLDRSSPLRRRGPDLDIAIPYITPSLREYPVAPSSTDNWSAKWVDCAVSYADIVWHVVNGSLTMLPPLCDTNRGGGHYPAPWRSLLYRNVETPFSYADDFVVYPKMPMNSPGHDCRAPRLLGEWMVSIPARRVSAVDEDAVPSPDGLTMVDGSPQPYVEVLPGDADYADALLASQARLDEYMEGQRYAACPDQNDIVDHAVLNRVNRGDPLVPPHDAMYDRREPSKLLQHDLGVPVRAHWVVTDLTEVPGDWYPRRPDWADVLVEQKVEDPGLSAEDQQAQRDLVAMLQDVRLTPEIVSYVTTELAYGLWQEKPGCDLSGQQKVSEMSAAERPAWIDQVSPPGGAHVYRQSPGAAIFTTVCVNCHGPNADSVGLLSDAIMMMTGGDARVANLRDGLFGPVSDPGGNRERVFGAHASGSASVDDWAARYLAWMTLGGTQRVLPPALLNIVAATRVLGAKRASNQISPTGSPNMLKLAKELCMHALPAVDSSYELQPLFSEGHLDWGGQTGLIDVNADAEMWQRLCSLGHAPVVRVPYVEQWTAETGGSAPGPRLVPERSLYHADAFPANAPVLDHRGQVVNGVKPDNLFPLCIRKPADPVERGFADAFIAAQPVKPPYCPPELFADNERWRLKSIPDPDIPGRRILTEARLWALRGAVNAALAVFVYLDRIQRGLATPAPAYNQCEQL